MTVPDLQSLISAWLDGRISHAESEALQAELRRSAEARREFQKWTSLDAALKEMTDRVLLTPGSQTVPKPRRALFAFATLAAIGLLLALLLWPHPAERQEATSSGVATLSQLLDAKFSGQAWRSGDTLSVGLIQLSTGMAQIEFFSGATAILEGETHLEILSAWEARCVQGRVRVHVPPAAKGFLLHTPDMKLEDLGTEFALNVEAGKSAVKVFDGEVLAHTSQAPASLTTGMTLGTTARDFLAVADLQTLVTASHERQIRQWEAWSHKQMSDSRLIAYYTFKRWSDPQWDRLVNNFTSPPRKQRSGGAVGARWTQGRWPEKSALEFKRPGDRVRLNLDGTYHALTMACWVKVDSVDKKYNSLLLTDGYENGEPHWQIYEDGSLMFSIRYRPDGEPHSGKFNQMYFSKPVFTPDTIGRWHHIAVSYDGGSGQVIQYFDGIEVGRDISPLHQPGRELTFGPCEIGNWGLPTQNHAFPVRNLNGAIDEFAIYSAALTASEIRESYLNGKPE